MSPIVALPGCNPVSGCSDSPSSCSGQLYPDLVAAQTGLLSELTGVEYIAEGNSSRVRPGPTIVYAIAEPDGFGVCVTLHKSRILARKSGDQRSLLSRCSAHK